MRRRSLVDDLEIRVNAKREKLSPEQLRQQLDESEERNIDDLEDEENEDPDLPPGHQEDPTDDAPPDFEDQLSPDDKPSKRKKRTTKAEDELGQLARSYAEVHGCSFSLGYVRVLETVRGKALYERYYLERGV